jgi:hypothetical protein
VGHFEAAKRILGYLKMYPGHWIVFNPNPIDLSHAVEKFTEYDGWREFYPEAQEEVPDGNRHQERRLRLLLWLMQIMDIAR